MSNYIMFLSATCHFLIHLTASDPLVFKNRKKPFTTSLSLFRLFTKRRRYFLGSCMLSQQGNKGHLHRRTMKVNLKRVLIEKTIFKHAFLFIMNVKGGKLSI